MNNSLNSKFLKAAIKVRLDNGTVEEESPGVESPGVSPMFYFTKSKEKSTDCFNK